MSDISVTRLDFPISYGSAPSIITLNDHRNATGARITGTDQSSYWVERFDFSPIQYRDQREGLHLADGGDLGTATRVFRRVSLVGLIRETTPALLLDREARLLRAFDMTEQQINVPTQVGQRTLQFYSPTAVAPAGLSSPVPEFFYCRPAAFPRVYDLASNGLTESFAIELICADPVRYATTATTVTLNSGNSFSAAAPNWDATSGSATWGVVRLNLGAGAHNAAVTLTFTPTSYGSAQSLVLNLSNAAFTGSHTVDVDMRTKFIVLDASSQINEVNHNWSGGTERAECRSSAVDTYWLIPANGGTFSATNTANITSIVMTYHQARA